jgi:hypothetical protein
MLQIPLKSVDQLLPIGKDIQGRRPMLTLGGPLDWHGGGAGGLALSEFKCSRGRIGNLEKRPGSL